MTVKDNRSSGAPVPAATSCRPGGAAGFADMLERVALPNLTRDQAVERAALVTVHSYQIHLDVTDGSRRSG